MLTQHEQQDPVWMKLKDHLEKKLTDLRKQNDSDMPEDKTIKLRGRIFELKKLLDLGNPKPDIED